MRRLPLALAAAALLLTATAPSAFAQDSLAPKGALPHWLPTKRWVYEHWVPFDEGRLYRLLRADRGTIWRHLRDDAAHDLAQLGQRRGYTADALAARLVAPRAGEVSAARLKTLRARAKRILVQGHLSQHILFHSLHQRTIPLGAPALFGTASVEEYLQLRRAELSPIQIGRQHGRTRAEMQRAVEKALRATNAEGVRTGSISRRQARLLLDRQLRQVPRWLGQARYNGPPQTGTKGARSIPLLPPGDYANNPTITDDGTTVVFDAYRAKIPEAKRNGEISVVSYDVGAAKLLPISHPLASTGPLAPRSAYNSSVSADGSTVVYEAAEGNLNFAKRYSEMQVLARARPAVRAASSVSHPRGVRKQGSRSAYNPSVSADGHLVAFEATDDGAGKTPSRNGVWVRNLATGTDQLIGQGSGGAVYEPHLVGDGSGLLFTAADAGADGHTLVYLRALGAKTTTLVSRLTGADGAAASDDASQPTASRDGGLVAFASTATNLGARRDRARIFVRDLRTGTTTAVTPRDAFAFDPSISADGTFVTYALRRGKSPARSSVWLTDRVTGATTLISEGGDGYNAEPVVSADGTRVAFTSTGGKLSPRKATGLAGVFLRDVTAGTTTLLSTHTPLKAKASAAGQRGETGAFLCPLAP
ncbi:MAG: PD40 domain-containing protein [Solirubrobacteraceae bacterium]|nr:PD40 domain-containing protein [Solirubrobacteraceae bacterium]